MHWLLSPVTLKLRYCLVSASAGWHARLGRRPRQFWGGDKPATLARRRAAQDRAVAERCARSEGPKETAIAQAKWQRELIADAERNGKSRDGTAVVEELVDRAFKLRGRVG